RARQHVGIVPRTETDAVAEVGERRGHRLHLLLLAGLAALLHALVPRHRERALALARVLTRAAVLRRRARALALAVVDALAHHLVVAALLGLRLGAHADRAGDDERRRRARDDQALVPHAIPPRWSAARSGVRFA